MNIRNLIASLMDLMTLGVLLYHSEMKSQCSYNLKAWKSHKLVLTARWQSLIQYYMIFILFPENQSRVGCFSLSVTVYECFQQFSISFESFVGGSMRLTKFQSAKHNREKCPSIWILWLFLFLFSHFPQYFVEVNWNSS